MGGQRLPLEPDRGEPEGEGLAEPYPSARRSQSFAVRAPEVGEHDALEGARPCRARIRPAAELDGRQDRAHHSHRAGEVQDWHDEPRLHPPAWFSSSGWQLHPLECAHGWTPCGIVQRAARTPARRQNGPRLGTHLGTSAATARSAKTEIAESEYCSMFPLEIPVMFEHSRHDERVVHEELYQTAETLTHLRHRPRPSKAPISHWTTVHFCNGCPSGGARSMSQGLRVLVLGTD